MKCTGCNSGTLEPGYIDNLFKGRICSNCKGYWILIEDFTAWKKCNPDYQFDDNFRVEEEPSETSGALLCPVTGILMSKFKVSSKNHHRIDYSANVGGIWLDKGEWELLKESGLAASLNHIVTQSWQHKLRSESSKNHFSKIYEEKFGKEVYLKVKNFREWMQLQPHKTDLKAYILAEDPYSAEK